MKEEKKKREKYLWRKTVFVAQKLPVTVLRCMRNLLAVLSRVRRNFFRVVFFLILGTLYVENISVCIGCLVFILFSFLILRRKMCHSKILSMKLQFWLVVSSAAPFAWLIGRRKKKKPLRTESAQRTIGIWNWNEPPRLQRNSIQVWK